MIMEWLRQWGSVSYAGLNLLLVWVLWSLGRRFVAREELKPFDERLQHCERDVLEIRHQLHNQPGHRELTALQQSQNTIEIKLARIEATVRKLDETTRRLNDYLLNRE